MFLLDETGGELAEYSVLLLFVCLCSIALFLSASDSVTGIWSLLVQTMSAARTVVRGSGADTLP
jgi:Flp pilus assembly pilin Flp